MGDDEPLPSRSAINGLKAYRLQELLHGQLESLNDLIVNEIACGSGVYQSRKSMAGF